MSRLLLGLLLCLGIACPDAIEFQTLKEGVLEQRLALAHPRVARRYQRLRSLFLETGCTALQEQRVKGSREPNLICPVDGAEPGARRIVVGAHYDSAGGDGTVDNWTGAILLPALAEFLREKPRRHSFHFVGFAAEEIGLLGSTAYLEAMNSEDRQQIAAVVTMDSLGLSPTKYWPTSSEQDLVNKAGVVARALRVEFKGVDVEVLGTTDSMTFHSAGIPVLSLHSLTQETLHIINSPRDVKDAVSWKDYHDTHRFVSALLVYLDQKLP